MIKKAMDNILACFSAEDGGMRFATLKFAVEEFAARAKAGDHPSDEICQVVVRFSNLIDVVNRR